MASLASLVSLGSAVCVYPLEGLFSLVRRVSLCRDNLRVGKRWRFISVCKYSVTANLVAEQGNANAISLDSAYRGSNWDDDDLVLKPGPKPVLKSVNSVVSWDSTSKLGGDLGDDKLEDAEERKKLIDSLGEVLEKAEKLEASRPSGSSSAKKVGGSVNRPSPSIIKNNMNTGKFVNSAVDKKTKTLKSVWKKGNLITSVQKFVKDSPKTSSNDVIRNEEPKNDEGVKVRSPPPLSQRSAQSLLRVPPKLPCALDATVY